MDRRERSGDAEAALLAALDNFQTTVWTSLPGIIQSFDRAKKTCVVQPALKFRVTLQDGTQQWIKMPVLLDCPVQFPSGGGVTLTFPLKQGDECLVVFASRCIDSWWQLGAGSDGAGQVQAEFRMHDLSDGFCVPGVSSVPRVEPNISTDAAELRSTDGNVRISLNPTTKEVAIVTPGNVTTTANGNVSVTALGTANFSIAGGWTVSAPNVSYDGNVSVGGKMQAATAQVKGAMTVGGSLSVGGSFGGAGFSISSGGANFGATGATVGALTVGGLAALTLKSTGGFRLPGGTSDVGATGALSALISGWGGANAQAFLAGLGATNVDAYCAAGALAALIGGGGAPVNNAQVETALRAVLCLVALAIGDVKNTHVI